MKRFYRRTQNKIFAGVASGLADYFGIDPVLVRVLFVFGTLFGVGSFFLVYIVLWFVLPKDYDVIDLRYANGNNKDFVSNNSRNEGNSFYNSVNPNMYANSYNNSENSFTSSNLDNNLENKKGNASVIFGIFLIIIGLISFASMFIPFFTFEIIFPIILITIGTLVVFGNKLK